MDDVKATKLVINLKDGIIQAEGDETFVRDVYNDFKEVVSKRAVISPNLAPTPAAIEQITDANEQAESARAPGRSPQPRVRRQGVGTPKGGDASFKPKFDNDLDLTGIDEYYAKYSPTNNSEKILVFAGFMRDQLGKVTFTAHEIYTCYFTAKEKIPSAFVQAFRDCQSRTHFIKFTTMMDIEIAIPGANWLNGQGKKKAATE